MKNTTTRRQFLGASLAAPLMSSGFGAGLLASQAPAAASQSGKGKKLLVLGGTRFLGPAIVDYALSKGYEVTLFNRGKSNPDLYSELETRIGDRDTGNLSALEEGQWDAVVDTSCYVPQHARKAAQVLKDRVGQYVLISTISVYDALNDGTAENRVDENGVIHEDSALSTMDNDVAESFMTINSAFAPGTNYYGPLKVLCERAVEEVLPGRTTSLRPGVIAGRDDPSDRFTYWVVRCAQGGEILCPGEPGQNFQYTDVQDLGQWSVDLGMAGTSGVFNTIGFPGRVTMEEFLHGCKIATGQTEATYTWADEEFLLENEVTPFTEMPFWLPKEAQHTYALDKLITTGAPFRPIGDTIRATLDWHRETRPADFKWRRYGMQPEREADLLAKWHAR